ncbi:MAG: GNAT family N-acetyltransferase [Acidobacteria bacterium]|nr:GNAT family N-acetyltransferase [Acidobacteriota bacterium]
MFILTSILNEEPEAETGLKFSAPAADDWVEIRRLIGLFRLDADDLSSDQFVVCKNGETLLGFGRLKRHPECDELSSLAVLRNFRGRGIGRRIVAELLGAVDRPVFIVTVIPAYFARLGFVETKSFPLSIKIKLAGCETVCGGGPTVMIPAAKFETGV